MSEESNLMPEGWISKPLGKFIGVQGGYAFKSEDFSEVGIPIVRISNLKKNGGIDLQNAVYTKFNPLYERFEVRFGDVLIAMSGATTGKVGRYRSSNLAYLNQRVGRFYIKDKSKMDLDYVHQITSTDQFVGSVLIDAAGGAQPNISNQQIEAFNVALPPLPEQQKIATILSSVDKVIETTRAQIDKLKDLKTAMMQELLTKGVGHTEFKDSLVGRIPASWDIIELSILVKKERPVTYGIVQTGTNIEGGIPCVRVVDLMKNDLSTDDMIRTSQEISQQYKRTILQEGDIMFALRGDIGRVRIAGSSLVGSNLTRGVALISPSEKVISGYLLWSLRSPTVRSLILDGVNGSALQEIPLGNLRSIQIPVPPMHEQKELAHVMDSIEFRLMKCQQKLESICRIKKSLMQDLLTGKVRVNVDNNKEEREAV